MGELRTAMRARGPGAFTLVELLIVITLMLMAMGMIALLPSGAKRDSAVSGAAQELAATLRLAHGMAIDKKATYAVAFNITNGPGTSGKVLNNWGGGHWYQILGPDDNDFAGGKSWPMFPTPSWYDPTPLSDYLGNVKSCFVGDRHVLPARKVRFLALGDQDNGGNILSYWPYSMTYVPTYPRAWCGYWDGASKRLYPWGGYDTTTPVNGNGRQASGFFYEGLDGPITGCVNPVNRVANDPGAAQIFAQGKPRPLINGEWADYVLEFFPDGTAGEAMPFYARQTIGSWGPPFNLSDMAGNIGTGFPYTPSYGQQGQVTIPGTGSATGVNYFRPTSITSFQPYTGVWAITLAPDIDQDTDRFGDAQSAFQSIMPAYRVTMTAFAQVKVVKVSTTYQGTGGGQFDTTMDGLWQDWPNGVNKFYQGNMATNPDMTLRGYPVMDFLSPDMLAQRHFWLTAP
jgi:type II secretory pathway pseudopilin PulG